MSKKMTIAILGLGSRGLQVYAPLIKENGDQMELVAVADLDPAKINVAQEEYGIPEEACFSSAEKLLKENRLADAIFICTQDCYAEKWTAGSTASIRNRGRRSLYELGCG